MSNATLIRRYLAVASPDTLQPDAVRSFLADDFTIHDELMGSTEGADAFVEKLRSLGPTPGMKTHVDEVIGEGDVVAALTRLEVGDATVTYATWYWIADGKITRQRSVYDPRAFLAMPG